MADAGPDDTTRLVTIFLGANDASMGDQNPAQHVAWRLKIHLESPGKNGKTPGKQAGKKKIPLVNIETAIEHGPF